MCKDADKNSVRCLPTCPRNVAFGVVSFRYLDHFCEIFYLGYGWLGQ